MGKKSIITLTALILTLLVTGATIAQEQPESSATGKLQKNNFGKTFAISLTTEPGEAPEVFTIMTAGGQFMFSSSETSGEARSSLNFHGSLKIVKNGMAMVGYSLSLDNAAKAGQASQQVNLGGSVLVRIDSEVLIAKAKDHSFKLKVTVAK